MKPALRVVPNPLTSFRDALVVHANTQNATAVENSDKPLLVASAPSFHPVSPPAERSDTLYLFKFRQQYFAQNDNMSGRRPPIRTFPAQHPAGTVFEIYRETNPSLYQALIDASEDDADPYLHREPLENPVFAIPPPNQERVRENEDSENEDDSEDSDDSAEEPPQRFEPHYENNNGRDGAPSENSSNHRTPNKENRGNNPHNANQRAVYDTANRLLLQACDERLQSWGEKAGQDTCMRLEQFQMPIVIPNMLFQHVPNVGFVNEAAAPFQNVQNPPFVAAKNSVTAENFQAFLNELQSAPLGSPPPRPPTRRPKIQKNNNGSPQLQQFQPSFPSRTSKTAKRNETPLLSAVKKEVTNLRPEEMNKTVRAFELTEAINYLVEKGRAGVRQEPAGGATPGLQNNNPVYSEKIQRALNAQIIARNVPLSMFVFDADQEEAENNNGNPPQPLEHKYAPNDFGRFAITYMEQRNN